MESKCCRLPGIILERVRPPIQAPGAYRNAWDADVVFFILTIFFLACPQHDCTVPFIHSCFKDSKLGLLPTTPLGDLKLSLPGGEAFRSRMWPELISQQSCCSAVSPPVWPCQREVGLSLPALPWPNLYISSCSNCNSREQPAASQRGNFAAGYAPSDSQVIEELELKSFFGPASFSLHCVCLSLCSG